MKPDDAMGPADVDPVWFARHIASSSDAELAAAMRTDGRTLVLDEVLARMERHFHADRAHDVDAVVHWRIADRESGGHDVYEVVIAGGTGRAGRPPALDPSLTFTLGAVDFMRLVTGGRHGPVLFLRRRLRISGDLALAARMTSLFAIPSA